MWLKISENKPEFGKAYILKDVNGQVIAGQLKSITKHGYEWETIVDIFLEELKSRAPEIIIQVTLAPYTHMLDISKI